MQLSIIIVNYRVRYFLEQCLHSVAQAIKGLEAEVIVVDNHSQDGSVEYLTAIFPWVKFLPLSENLGFAKANNLGLQKAGGKYVLFLNPDTIVAEDAFTSSICIMEQQQDVGALGIKMLDGSGRFLKESKRGFPSPVTSFYKLSGLAVLFPKSRIFARYYLGHLPQEKDNEVEVLAGAYMLLRKSLLDKIEGFDERFFMYGEDIDLSYRVSKAGMKNYYLANSSIIHFKGESTRKGTLNYVKIFYQAMILFVQKHYDGAGAKFYRGLLQTAIWFRALFTAVSGFFRQLGLPVLDAAITLLCLWIAMKGWYRYVKPDTHLEDAIRQIAFPVFAATFLLTAAIAGLYDAGFRVRKVLSATLAGVLAVVACYSLLPEQYRFSRGIIVLAGLLSSVGILLLRWLMMRMGWIAGVDALQSYKQTVVAGTQSDFAEVEQLMKRSGNESRLLGRIDIADDSTHSIGHINGIAEALRKVNFRELVFVISPDLPAKKMIGIMQQYPELLRYKMYYRGSKSLVGSDSKDRSGEVFAASSHFNLAKHSYRRSKRVFDLFSSMVLLVLAPVLLLFQSSPSMYLQQVWAVLTGSKTWIGYAGNANALPPLKPAVLAVDGQRLQDGFNSDAQLLEAIEHRYAAEYFWSNDLRLLCRHFRAIGKA
ncbi:MAG TPA: glycosyltransferase [Phnomibacter sp.]|nr:glycosyltransferase [Phnomibacter sp.]